LTSFVLKVRSFKSIDAGKTWTYDSDTSGTQTLTDKASLWIDRLRHDADPVQRSAPLTCGQQR
jgi:hypothetical protein